MRWRFAVALGVALAAGAAWYWQSGEARGARFVTSEVLQAPDANFGGLSGYDISDGRRLFVADRGQLFISFEGGFEGVPLRDGNGLPLKGSQRDAEGLAAVGGRRIAVSFEGEHRVAIYSEAGDLLELVPSAEGFEGFGGNSGLEALAVDAEGRLLMLPERSGASTRPFPVYVYDGAWRELSLPRRGAFLPVGADFGPDGRLYLLERDYLLSAFRTRIRRFDWDGEALSDEETLLQTRFFTHGNLEGIAVFEEGGETFVEMVSDNNFLPIQSSELVRYKLIVP